MPSAVQVLSAVGALVVLKSAYDLLRLAAVYTLPSNLPRYLYGPAPYALVTGATDGIGKSVAKELYKRGFNLILHGRNAAKMEKVREEIQGLDAPRKDVKVWLADANSPEVDFEGAVAQWAGLEITLVVHNVGGAPVREPTIDGIPASDLLTDIHRNALFPLFLTRALLPKLRRAAGPVEVVFCGSLSSVLPTPRIIPYAASKAFLRQLSDALSSDELYRAPRPSNVSYIYIDVGSVASGGHKITPSLASPSSDTFARHLVHCIGCGRASIVPYWFQALQLGMIRMLPRSVMLPELFKAMDVEFELAKKD
ncbi:NAD(P)-binding protein [Phanerochaete sordida]|uniref:NAD(P)-binding protein n=1 Tax=Phanerochaete sordida TaxID=48140 RepID=A0A9P3GDV1_9APHY|nr:NAD(P)-binding protein [Phanerochaete sordida]